MSEIADFLFNEMLLKITNTVRLNLKSNTVVASFNLPFMDLENIRILYGVLF